MTWAMERPAASMASASRNFVTICSGVCLVRFIVESLRGQPVAHRDSHKRLFQNSRCLDLIDLIREQTSIAAARSWKAWNCSFQRS